MTDRLGIRGRNISLFVRFSDPAGNPINSDTTPRVEISDPNGTVVRLLNTTGVTQIIDSVGLYQFDYLVPLNTIDGYYVDKWVAVIGGETVTSSFQFFVQESGSIAQDIEAVFTPDSAAISFNFTKCEANGISSLMRILKKRLKSDGTRKIPDGIGGFINESCVIFNDDELTCFLVNSLSEFNQWPHFTSFTFCDAQITGLFADIIIQGAVLLALAAQTLIEKGREFTITDNGVTYQPPQVSEILNSQYTTQLGYYKEKLKAIKTSLKPGPMGLGTFRVTAVSPNFLRLRHLRERQIV